MIDIHSHVLCGLDDGARSLDESVAMIRMAADAGTTDIVASPHANQEYAFDPWTVERKICELQAMVGNFPRIYFGCDFHLTAENLDDALRSPEKYSINHRGYLLVEFSDFHIPRTTGEIFERLVHAGMRPIVTHPERNPLLQNRLEDLEAWVSQGALVQVTAQSLLGRFGRSAKASALELMECGLVHFLASDAHDLKHRTTALSEPRRYVEKTFGAETASLVFEENPRAVLSGIPLTVLPPTRRKKWFCFH
ncbi:MAG: CpsB/CapC family capsule biosynthesis tyrosine phosphatase [Bryobacteraceae bacterium]